MPDVSAAELRAVVERLCAASNAHDLEAITACFTPTYRNETPLHPARGFVGAGQVRRNWAQILLAVPDLVTRVTSLATDPVNGRVWTEWEHRGTRPDGSPHRMGGVIVFTVEGGAISAARFYLEPVDDDATGVDAAVLQHVTGSP